MKPNRLSQETSPYLLQHAHNPVDWYPWGEEALKKAKRENKPILLSIGYSACHWCHVMAHESFEDEAIAALMDQHFVCIKVDREERPDLDELYQAVVQMLTGRGGWPLTVFLTPEQKPFYGGTYFPPQDRPGLPGLPRVLIGVARAYQEHPDAVESNTVQFLAGLKALASFSPGGELNGSVLHKAFQAVKGEFDPQNGGFGTQPKFPQAPVLAFLLRYSYTFREGEALKIVTETLRHMARGGIYDHLGGGFHRYSVGGEWRVPHFEKMLYDNALLLALYAEGYQATGEPLFKKVMAETVGYLFREMLQPGGGFYSTQDADSEGEEGKYYVWSREQVLQALGPQGGEVFCRAYGVTSEGSLEGGRNVLYIQASPAELYQELGRPPEEIEALLLKARQKLLLLRQGRAKPGRDEKVITGWNGLVASALLKAYPLLEDGESLKAALSTLEFIWANLYQGEVLAHSYKDGRAGPPGFLEDYAFFIAALLDAFEATFEPKYLDRARELAGRMRQEFWDEVGFFYFTGQSQEPLISRLKSSHDSAIPSGASVAVADLLRLSHLTGEDSYLREAERTLQLFGAAMEDNPFGYGGMLCALSFYLDTPQEIVLSGSKDAPGAKEMLAIVRRAFLPHRVLYWGVGGGGRLPPLAQGKAPVGGKATVYICHRFTCSPPLTDPRELESQLRLP